MNIEDVREYCLSKKGVTESFPFDATTLVFKVLGRIFLLTDLESEFSINIKCNPDLAVELRERYDCVEPGYHMNKTCWNTVLIDGSIPDSELYRWINHSYEEVVKKLTKKQKELLDQM
ncbi:MAG TPA: MmcQ/YjbR family DNA-binding protein [Bacteroidales bacterium]|nr:MmcQ/YjbR family DNA-binding protein [Bacteroidales bacterium]HQN17429.1 MmcQ/YjbR family DNA-binding protein [Bacteroidales bacterium]HQP16915.1 MmcQ/YjbR family DNA-binding protein [Bacteroidales bacterium]